MIQQTTLQAYESIKCDLSRRRRQIFDVIKSAGVVGVTNLEVSNKLNLPIKCVTGRTRDLVKLGYVKQGKKRPDLFTGNRCISWVVV